jgi:hypothetical protein
MKNTIAAFALTVIMAASAFANGGIIVSDLNGNTKDNKPCTETVKVDSGIIVSDIIGIIVSDFTGIIVSDRQAPTVNCGIIVSDLTGIIVGD